MKNASILLVIVGVCFCSCSSAQIDLGYPFYAIHPELDRLEAHDPTKDLVLGLTCNPDAQSAAKCYALLRADFEAMAKELLELRQKVSDCENPEPKPMVKQ